MIVKTGEILHFYPRPPRGGRHLLISTTSTFQTISIHALREEGDGETGAMSVTPINISIHALREEGDCGLVCHSDCSKISIHALREEGD